MDVRARVTFLLLLLLAGPASALQFDPDVDLKVRTQFLQDLEFVSQIEGEAETPLFSAVFGKLDGPSLRRWFESRVSEVGKNLCGSDIAVACVLSAWNEKIWLAPNYNRFQHPQVARVMVLFHEARHTEESEGHWPHARCPKVFKNPDGSEITSLWTGARLGGEAACDLTEFGSYGSATILLSNLARHCANCSEKVKMDAAIYAQDHLKRIIWVPARERMEAEGAPLKPL